MQFLWKYVDDLVGKGLEWYVIAELLFYAAATFVPLALPLAILLSSIMTFGNLAEHFELVAIKAAGISLQRVMMPLIITSILICGAAFYFSNNVLPVANLKMGSLLFDVREQKPALNIKEGVFYSGIEGYVMKVAKKQKDGQTVEGIMIYDHTNNHGNFNMTVADKGKMVMTKDKRYLLISLFDGFNYMENKNTQKKQSSLPFQRTKFAIQNFRFDLSDFRMSRSKEDLFKDNYQMLNLHQLKEAVDSMNLDLVKRKRAFTKSFAEKFQYYYIIHSDTFLKSTMQINPAFIKNFDISRHNRIYDNAILNTRSAKEHTFFSSQDIEAREKNITKYVIEWHRKFTLSFACLILFFIGAPLGAIIRKGGFGMPMVASVGFFLIFHVLSITGEKMVKEGVVPTYQGMWLASLVLLPVGIVLSYMATTDSAIFDKESYLNFATKLFKRNKRVKK